MTEIIYIEWILEVFPVLLFQLNPFEWNEKQLNEEAERVQDVQHQHPLNGHGQDEWDNES